MAALPNGLPARHTTSKTKINNLKGDVVPIAKPFVAGFSPDEYLLDANSWPEYRIKDSDYYNKNYRLFPQGQQGGGNYQGGMMGGAMSYGQRMSEGMEGPYGDGNYGFQAGPPQIVSDEPSPPETQADEDNQVTMSPTSAKIQKLVMKQQSKYKDLVKQNFEDAATKASRDEGSGSADGSGSGQYFLGKADKADTHIPESQGKHVKTGKDESGQGTVDTKPDEPSKKPDSGKVSVDTPSLPIKSAQDSGIKVPESATPDQSQTKIEKSSNKDTNSASNLGSGASKEDSSASKQDKDIKDTKPSKQDSGSAVSKQENDSETQDTTTQPAHSSPLGEFAKFLKSKGITLTINKDKPSKTDPGPSQRDEKGSSDIKASSSSSDALQSAGDSTTASLNPSTENGVASQEESLNNAVMNWQNISPQASQAGGIFLRHDTKQHQANH